jgi:hypothetical protein
MPFAGIVVGDTEQPERLTFVLGPEFATVIWIVSLTFEIIEKVPELAMLFWSAEYVPVIVADEVGVYATPHDPDESVQGLAENMPLLSVDCQVIIPRGKVARDRGRASARLTDD